MPTCGGVAYAQSHGLPALTFPAPKKGGFAGLSVDELVVALTEEHRMPPVRNLWRVDQRLGPWKWVQQEFFEDDVSASSGGGGVGCVRVCVWGGG